MQGNGNQMTPEEIEALRTERDRLQAERDQANQRADAETRRAETLQGQVLTSGRQLAESAVQNFTAQEAQATDRIASLTTELSALQAQRKALLEEGKFEEEGDINIKISEAVSARQQALQAKAWYGQQKTQAAAQPSDPVERFLATRQYSDAEKSWIRRNPQYALDEGFQRRVNSAHEQAVQKFAAGSPEYFAELERAGYMRSAPQQQPDPRRQQQPSNPDPNDGGEGGDGADDGSPYSDAAQGDNVPQQPQRPAARVAAAAPSRRSPTAPTVNGRRVQAELSPDQMEIAMRMAESGAAPDEVLAGGVAAVAQWWNELNTGAAAARKREEWATL